MPLLYVYYVYSQKDIFQLYYAHVTSVGFEHSVCREPLLTSFLYIPNVWKIGVVSPVISPLLHRYVHLTTNVLADGDNGGDDNDDEDPDNSYSSSKSPSEPSQV